MKNILIAALILVVNFCTAQVYVNQIDINKFDYQYLELWEHYNKQNGKFYAMIDYGQNAPKSGTGESYKVNEQNGDPKKFNGTVSMLNFLHKNGWELVGIKKTDEINSYILKRISEMKEEPAETDSADSDSEAGESETNDDKNK